MKFSLAILGQALAFTAATQLTSANYDEMVSDKIVFLKFLAPW